mmetsp:Transcript_1017/g.3572  ORF Transcript_1017/g.3572 Transcript_1017/m.3572 type:complete len:109 (-) Transcript_1017:1984-2310(-)
MSLRQAANSWARVTARALASPSAAAPSKYAAPVKQARGFAAGGHHDTHTSHGISVNKPSAWHLYGARAFGAVAWFWIFYRMREDGPALLGLRHHWEGHDDHGHDGKEH